MTIEVLKRDLLRQLTDLSILNQIVTPIYVDTNPASITKVEIHKKGNKIIQEKIEQIEKLNKHRIIAKSSSKQNIIICDAIKKETITRDENTSVSISKNINSNFYYFINKYTTNRTRINFFNQNFFKRIFNPIKKQDIINKVLNYDRDYNWIIVSDNIYNILKNSQFFKQCCIKDKGLIKNKGYLLADDYKLSIYVDDSIDNNNVIFGKYDSLTLIINRNINIEESKLLQNIYDECAYITVEYLFKQNGKMAILEII